MVSQFANTADEGVNVLLLDVYGVSDHFRAYSLFS
jgi:hypothetical protein